ncbi:SIMPL domain-containing protein [Clostridium polyendosporum]|uniref:SIMPL domain-containing protein n=1 Tax=Clostridium polyendosporum TaxID=69208 RepID=A0A919VKG9_9CLOT|nr:SIMPL domain-containing protein [Clostridium polyendosporum]GIM27603.1 SIMPL domain-containing protein [Clostridium polyendosporum]
MMNYMFFNPDLYTTKKGNMKINGVGTVKVEPNVAVVNLSVITENINLKVAQEENAIKSTAVINELHQMGIPNKQIRTASYNIEPQYDYVDGKQIFRGYKVTNTLSVTIKNITKVGEVIDRATSSGVNRVDNIIFTVEDTSIYYNQALNLAIKNAVQKAVEIGNSLGVDVDKTPSKITEESYSSAFEEVSMMKLAAPTTPILPGQINITARIEAIFNYKQ